MDKIKILVDIEKCDFCGTCAGVCPENAIEPGEAYWKRDENLCTGCLGCVHICPMGALEGRR